jgi:hypothetical protein
MFVKLNKKGRIPANTFCPFKGECVMWKNKINKSTTINGICGHKGENHKTEYSCGSARGFDIELKYKKENRSLDN